MAGKISDFAVLPGSGLAGTDKFEVLHGTNQAIIASELAIGLAALFATAGIPLIAVGPYVINAQVGTTYTPVLADANKWITLNNAAAITFTVPTNASVPYPIGTILTIEQLGVGQVTLAGAIPPTLLTAASLKTRTQNSVVQLKKGLTDTWTVYGDLQPPGQVFNPQSGTTYTLVIGDAYKYITLSNAGAITLTVPPNSSVPFPIGIRIDLEQIGAGQVTVAQGAGVTINNTPGLKFRAQYSTASLVKKGTDLWNLSGDISA